MQKFNIVVILLFMLYGCWNTNEKMKRSDAKSNSYSNFHKCSHTALEQNKAIMDKVSISLPPISKEDSARLERCLSELKEIIIQDTSCSVSFQNYANILLQLGRRNEAILSLKKCVDLRPNFAEGYGLIGMIYDGKGISDSAIIYYNKSIVVYDYLINQRESTVMNHLNKAFILSLVDTKKGKKEIELIKNKYPEDKLMIESFSKQFFEDFNKDIYFHDMGIEK